MNGVNGLIGNRTLSAVEKMAAFTEARQKVIAENIANVDTPGYRHKDVDLRSFQQALAGALSSGRDDAPLGQVASDQVRYDAAGRMVLEPSVDQADNTMFHDGTNGSIEQDVSEMARNLVLHQVSIDVMRHHYGMLQKAIRGRMM